MTLQPITYHGRNIAAATRARFFLCDELDERPVEDPERRWVIFMCAYAVDVLAGRLPGPYTEANARRYAQVCLVPLELVEQTNSTKSAARALGVPLRELEDARAAAVA